MNRFKNIKVVVKKNDISESKFLHKIFLKNRAFMP